MFVNSKIAKILIILFVAVISITICNIAAAELKLGVIDTQKVFDEFKKAQEANKIIEKAVNRLKNEIGQMQKELRDMEKRWTEAKIFLEDQDPKKAQMQDDILIKRQELGNQIETGQQLIEKKRQELAEPILKEIEDLIKETGKSQGYSLIFEKRLVTLYVDPKYDLTDYVINQLNVKYEKEQKQKNQKKNTSESNKNKNEESEKKENVKTGKRENESRRESEHLER